MRRLLLLLTALGAALLVSSCGGGADTEASGGTDSSASSGDSSQRFPDVRKAELTRESDGRWTVAVTVSSPYDTPDRYADGWRVLAGKGTDGTVLGSHELLHDHASEQPFTRTQTGLEIPDDVEQVTVQGHDQDNGFGGGTATVEVP